MTNKESVTIGHQHQTCTQLLIAVGTAKQITVMDILPIPFQARQILLCCDTYHYRKRHFECWLFKRGHHKSFHRGSDDQGAVVPPFRSEPPHRAKPAAIALK